MLDIGLLQLPCLYYIHSAFVLTWKTLFDFSHKFVFPFLRLRFIFLMFSFSDLLRTCYASDAENLFPKLLCSESSNIATSHTVLSTHHQTSLRNNTKTWDWSFNINTEGVMLVINPFRCNIVQFCRANTFSLIFTSVQFNLCLSWHVQASSKQFTMSGKLGQYYHFYYEARMGFLKLI